MTSVIPMVGCYVGEMAIIRQSMGAARTGEEYCSKYIPFTWGPTLAQWIGK